MCVVCACMCVCVCVCVGVGVGDSFIFTTMLIQFNRRSSAFVTRLTLGTSIALSVLSKFLEAHDVHVYSES